MCLFFMIPTYLSNRPVNVFKAYTLEVFTSKPLFPGFAPAPCLNGSAFSSEGKDIFFVFVPHLKSTKRPEDVELLRRAPDSVYFNVVTTASSNVLCAPLNKL